MNRHRNNKGRHDSARLPARAGGGEVPETKMRAGSGERAWFGLPCPRPRYASHQTRAAIPTNTSWASRPAMTMCWVPSVSRCGRCRSQLTYTGTTTYAATRQLPMTHHFMPLEARGRTPSLGQTRAAYYQPQFPQQEKIRCRGYCPDQGRIDVSR